MKNDIERFCRKTVANEFENIEEILVGHPAVLAKKMEHIAAV